MGMFSKLFGGGSTEDGERIRELLALCEDGDPIRRREACDSLGNLAGQLEDSKETVTDKLLEMINDADGDVCNSAADAYAKIERGFA